MPTYERRFYLTTLMEENIKKQEQAEEAQSNAKNGGKGTRTSTVSGEALKNQIKSGQLPYQ